MRPRPGSARSRHAGRHTLALALSLVGLVVSTSRGVTPSDKYEAQPPSIGLEWSAVSFESSRDGASLNGWWFEGHPEKPVLVLFDRGRGNMGDLLGLAREFVTRGFSVMTFDYRDFGPAGPGPVDTLVQLAFASRWVNDGEGAVRFARGRAGNRPVFAWGQELGGAIAVAVAARDRGNADAVACEGLFRTLPELLRASGLSQVPGVPERHRFLVETPDEPLAAVSGLVVPLHVVVAMKDEVWPAAATQDVTRRSLSRIDRWILPEGRHDGIELTPGYHDRISAWFMRIATMIRSSQPTPAATPAPK